MNRVYTTILLILFCLTIYSQQEYSVKQGETITSVAQKFNTSVDELRRLNPDMEMWFTGLVLKVPQRETASPYNLYSASNQDNTKLDKIVMKDGSYILCKISRSDARNVYFSQDGEDGVFDVGRKFIKEINYADGSKKKFSK